MSRAWKQLRFVAAYVSLNFSAAMEYRAAFISQTLGMVLNDAMMIVFWWMFFQRFPHLSGWEMRDILVLWGVVAASFGLGVAIFGNAMRLATVIARGQLDYYLVLPKNVLLHVLVSRMGNAAWGDVSFGVIAFLAAGHLSPGRVLLYLLLVATGCGIFVAYHVLVGSLAFWAGSAENLAGQASNALTNFALYPGGIFRGWVKVLIFTAIPAGLMGHLPAEQIRNPDPRAITAVAAFSCTALALAWWVFATGLRRYQSGNLVELRG